MEPDETNAPSPQEPKENPKHGQLPRIIALAVIIAAITTAMILFFPRRGIPADNEAKATPTAAATITPAAPTPTPLVADTFGYDIKKPFELVPVDMGDNGVGTGSGYRIVLGDRKYSADELMQKISFSPEVKFDVKKNADNDFTLTPLASLNPKQVYAINFKDVDNTVSYSWAFQTKDEFYVTATLPRDMATYVPINTGIEITFSQKDMGDLSQFFEISPKTEGRFEIHKNVVAFVPFQKLSYDTLYTVTVKAGFAQKDGLTLAEDTVFSFQTEPAPDPYKVGYDCSTFDFAHNLYNLYSGEIPAISFYTNIKPDAEVEFNLYKYGSEDEFKNDIELRDDRPYWCIDYSKPKSIEGKELVLTIKNVLQRDTLPDEDYYYMATGYLVLPDPLPEGYYIAVAKANGMERRAWIQINDMAIYVGLADNKTIGLIYDSASSLPVEGAEIVFEGFSMTTGPDGVAISDNAPTDAGNNRMKNYSVKREGHPTYFSTVGDNYYRSYDYGYYNYYDDYYSGRYNINDEYWGYLYTDRNMYLPTDTINIWGMLSGKDGIIPPKKMTVTLESYRSSEQTAIDEKEIELSGPNTFVTELSFKNLSEGSYYIYVESDGKRLLSRYINISEYQKPIYILDTAINKKIAAYGEKVNFGLTAEFFEGTPVSGMNYDYYISGISNDKSGMLTTDANGQASLEITAENDTRAWQPTSVHISVSNADQEETPSNGYEYFTLFPRDTMIKVESQTDENNNCQVNINTNKIDVDAVRNKEWYSEKDYTGAKTNVDMTIELHEKYYTATQTGTYYDFINKTTYPRYKYDLNEKLLNSFPLSSVDGIASFNFTREIDKGYYIIIRCNDGYGRPIEQREYLYNAIYYETQWRQIDYYGIGTNQDDYTWTFDNDTVTASILCNNKPVAMPENGKALYMIFRKGLIEYALSDATAYSFNLKKEYIPNIGVMAVYFDGKSMHSTYLKVIHYDYQNSKLNINVVPESNEYHPGDTAKFDIQVTDKSGNGRSAEVLLSVVDEAFFALWNQNVDILGEIYRQAVSTGYLGGDIPHTNTLEDNRNNAVGEGGEGGDEASPRVDFKDTAFFGTVTTDSSGHAQVSVKLPDNLTQWRVTYQGLTDDLCAGSGKININTRLPYFINTVFGSRFITGDAPVLQLRSFGTSVVPGENVDYTVKLEKDGNTIKEYTASAKAGNRAFVEFDPLEEGTYSYTAAGTYGSQKDAVKYDFEVLPGFIEQTRTDYATLSENVAFPEVKWPATVYFFNTNVKQYWNELIDLAYSYGQRVDSIIVRKQARDLLKEFFDQSWWYSNNEYDVKNYQLISGGIALLPYDSADPVLTAKVCSLGDGSFNYDWMKNYFYGVMSNEKSTSTAVAASFWGLACLREPILLDLNSYAAGKDLTLIDKLYTGLAYAYVGDLGSATAIYDETTRKYLHEDDLNAYISAPEEGYDSDDNQEATSLCALLAQKINAPQCKKFFSYVARMYGQDILTNLMRLTYIRNGIKDLSMHSSFDYELDGKKSNVSLDGIRTASMFLTADKLKEIKFSNIKGDITVATVYKAPLGELNASDPRLSIERTYLDRSGKEIKSFGPSDYVKVVLKLKFDSTVPTGVYVVEDYLPAALKYVSPNSQANQWVQDESRNVWYVYDVSGQKVSFYIYHNNLSTTGEKIEYFARTVNLGGFTADSAVVYNLSSNISGYSTRTRIEIK